MNKFEYSGLFTSLLGDGSYNKMLKDRTLKTLRKLSEILNTNKCYFKVNKHRQLIERYTKLPHMCSLLKIHKVGISLRSVVSCRGSACHLVDIVNQLTGRMFKRSRQMLRTQNTLAVGFNSHRKRFQDIRIPSTDNTPTSIAAIHTA